MRRTGRRTLHFLLLAAGLALIAQMPDWKMFRDREGNTYFIDRAGKIRIAEAKEFTYRPVSARGVDYYLNYGTTLINEHRAHEGLTVLKSLRALPPEHNRIVQAQVRATEVINTLRKKNGPRFTELDEAASLLFIESDRGVRAINDRMLYSFRGPAVLALLRKKNRARLEYRYEGVLFGARQEPPAGGGPGGYDFLIAVDSERFARRFKNIDEAVEHWRGIAGYPGAERRVLERRDDRVVYAFAGGGEPRYAGMEAVFVNGKYTHCARLITSDAGYRSGEKEMGAVIASFRMVPVQD